MLPIGYNDDYFRKRHEALDDLVYLSTKYHMPLAFKGLIVMFTYMDELLIVTFTI